MAKPLTKRAIYDGRWQGDRAFVHRAPWVAWCLLLLAWPVYVAVGVWEIGIRDAARDYARDWRDSFRRFADWKEMRRG